LAFGFELLFALYPQQKPIFSTAFLFHTSFNFVLFSGKILKGSLTTEIKLQKVG